jgi:hypothetical protein
MKLSHSYSRLKLYENCPLRYYHQCIRKDVADEGGEASRYGERIHEYLEHRLAKNMELPQDIAHYEVLCKTIEAAAVGGELHVEKELVLTEELTPTTWWEADAWLRSKLDVLILRGDTAIVFDWKTGKRNPDNFQMQLFAAQVFKHYPEVQHVKTCLAWLKTMQMDSEDFNRMSMNAVWTGIMGKIRRIYDSAESGVWPARPSGLCRFCPVRHKCDYAAL